MASKIISFEGNEYKISYDITGDMQKPYILVLHGWGANKELMKNSLSKYFSKFSLVFVDLPGFGASSITKALHTKEYAEIINEFAKLLKSEPFAIMGHSFGGKVSTLLSPKRLVLLSTAGILEPKPFKVRAKIALFKILKFFGLSGFYKIFATKDVAGMSKIMYDTLKNVVNEDFSDIFANTKSKTLIFWGEDDEAVHLDSGIKISKLIKDSKFYQLSGDHFFFLQHAEFIAKTIENEFNL